MDRLTSVARYGVWTDRHLALLCGISVEAARSLNRRAQQRGVVTALKLQHGRSCWTLTTKGRAHYPIRQQLKSNQSIWTALGICEFFVTSRGAYRLMTPPEVTDAFETLRQGSQLDLDQPGVQRSRLYWRKGLLSQVLVDLTLPGTWNPHRYAKRLLQKCAKLRLKSRGWCEVLDNKLYSFTVLSPTVRSEVARVAATHGITVHCEAVPLLSLAWGVSDAA